MTIEGKIHVYPLCETDDMGHIEKPGTRVVMPLPDCWLCQQGLCTQIQDEENSEIVAHGMRWQ